MVTLGRQGFVQLASLIVAGALGGCGRSGDMVVRSLSPPSVAGASSSSDPTLVSIPHSRDVILAWLAGGDSTWRLYTARTHDAGATWSLPVAVTPPGEPVHPHGESSPRLIGGSGGRLAIVWSSSWTVRGREWPASAIRFARSLDGGTTWSSPITLNDDSTTAPGSHSFHGVALEGDSGLVVGWLDERKAPGSDPSDPEGAEDASLYAVRSGDFGSTWGGNIPIADRVCPCCRVQLCAAGGRVTASWRRHFTGQVRDVVVADLGSPPALIHADNWSLAGCPHTGPALTADADGRRHLVWYTGARGRAGVYYSSIPGSAPEAKAPVVPLLAADRMPTAHVGLAWAKSVGPVAAFDVDSTGSHVVTLAQVDPRRGVVRRRVRLPGSEGGRYPQLAPVNGSAMMVVAWTVEESSRPQVRLAMARFGGNE